MVKNPPANARNACKRWGFDPWVGKIPRRGKWQPTPVFLPEQSHGQRSLAGYSPWVYKELDTTEHTHTYIKINWFQPRNISMNVWAYRVGCSIVKVKGERHGI